MITRHIKEGEYADKSFPPKLKIYAEFQRRMTQSSPSVSEKTTGLKAE
jgi:hypothetical protein